MDSQIIANSSYIVRYNYDSKGFGELNTYGGDLTTTFPLYGPNGPVVSYSSQYPKFTKNNYGYNEFKIDTDNFKMQGSSAAYKLELAKYSSLFLMKDGTS